MIPELSKPYSWKKLLTWLKTHLLISLLAFETYLSLSIKSLIVYVTYLLICFVTRNYNHKSLNSSAYSKIFLQQLGEDGTHSLCSVKKLHHNRKIKKTSSAQVYLLINLAFPPSFPAAIICLWVSLSAVQSLKAALLSAKMWRRKKKERIKYVYLASAPLFRFGCFCWGETFPWFGSLVSLQKIHVSHLNTIKMWARGLGKSYWLFANFIILVCRLEPACFVEQRTFHMQSNS